MFKTKKTKTMKKFETLKAGLGNGCVVETPRGNMPLKGLDTVNESVLVRVWNKTVEDKFFDIDCKLHLFNLSDLTKDKAFIEFIDDQLLCGSWRFYTDDESTILGIETTEGDKTILVIENEVSEECPLIFYRWLVKHHYNTEGLDESDYIDASKSKVYEPK